MKKINIEQNTILKKYTSIKVGGIAEYFAEPQDISELINLIIWSKSNKINFHLIGAGSNLLINNTFIKGLTICTKKLNLVRVQINSGLMNAQCGVMLPTISFLLAKNGCSGGEWMVGIPGTIGGGIFMNAGVKKLSISKYLLSVKVFNTETSKIYEIKRKDLIFNYRFSSFQANKLIILSAKFSFKPKGNKKNITEKTKMNLQLRTETQPYHLPSFGSVFKNPINNFAGKLIEESGLKGFKVGDAEISLMHANFITNTYNATSEDIMTLITVIQQKVLQKKGILLHPEVRMIGFDYP